MFALYSNPPAVKPYYVESCSKHTCLHTC